MSTESLRHFFLSCFIILHLFAVSVVAFETPLSPYLQQYVSLFRLGWGWGMYDVLPQYDRHVWIRGKLDNGTAVDVPFPGQTRPGAAAGISFLQARERYFLKAMSLPGGEPFREEFLAFLCRISDSLDSVSLVVFSSPIPSLPEWKGRMGYEEEEILSVPCSA